MTHAGTIWVLVCTVLLLAAMVGSASYGPDQRVAAEGISGSYLKQFTPVVTHRYLMWLDILVTYLLYMFIISLGEMVTAFATTSWFFTRKKESAFMPGLGAFSTVFRYHVGTAAKLSTYKFFFKMLRNFAAMLKAALRKAKQDNNIIRFLMATFLPLLSLYERFLKFISKDALVLTAMWGDDYGVASRKDYFMTKFRHPGDGYAIIGWSGFVMLSLKMSVSLFMGALTYLYCFFLEVSPLMYDITAIDTPIVPFLLVFITSMFLTSVWIAPFDMMLRTNIQCYSMDGEMFIGDQRFTEEFIQKFIDSTIEICAHLKNDRTFFCFACKKKAAPAKIGQSEGGAEWTEDMEELKQEEQDELDDLDDDDEAGDSPRKSPDRRAARDPPKELAKQVNEDDQKADFDDEEPNSGMRATDGFKADSKNLGKPQPSQQPPLFDFDKPSPKKSNCILHTAAHHRVSRDVALFKLSFAADVAIEAARFSLCLEVRDCTLWSILSYRTVRRGPHTLRGDISRESKHRLPTEKQILFYYTLENLQLNRTPQR